MEKKQWAIKVMDGKTQTGWLLVRHAVVAAYKSKGDAAEEAEWLNNFARKIKSKMEYHPARWLPEGGLETELQTPDSPSKNYTRMSSEPESTIETPSKSRTPRSSVGTRSTLEELIGSMVTGGTDSSSD